MLYGNKYPVLKVQPILGKNSSGETEIIRTEFLIPAIPYEGINYGGKKFLWIDSEQCECICNSIE